MKVVLTVEKWASKPDVFSKCEWDEKGEKLEVECKGWDQLAEFIQTDFLDEWDEKRYCVKNKFRDRLSKGLDFLEKKLKLANYSNRDESAGHRHTDNKFKLINLPEISVDVDNCLRLFDKKYRGFQKIQASNKLFQASKERVLSVASPESIATNGYSNLAINPFDVPYQRNPFFIGRKSMIEKIHEQLNQEIATTITQMQAISGLGGIGKTQTAVEYAYRYFYDQKSYDYVFWVNADTRSNLTNNFANLANQLALPVTKETQEEKIQAVRAWLNTHANWLLIFDNADSPGWLVPLMPQNPKGKMLITSRASSFVQIGIKKPLLLNIMSLEEGIDFLFERTDYDRTDTELEAATELNHELGGLPLALEQAGAYILNKGKTFRWYLNEYRKREIALLKESTAETGQNYTSIPRTCISRTWAINFEAVAEENPASSALLEFSAFLAPEDISYEILIKGISHLGRTLEEYPQIEDHDDALTTVEDLIEPLSQYSLVQWKIPIHFYSVHSMVQAVVRDGIDQPTKVKWIERAIEALASAHPGYDFKHKTITARLLPHWLKIVMQADQMSIKSVALGQIMHQTGFYFRNQGLYNEAELFFREALALRQELLGEVHPDVATSFNNLAILYCAQGRYSEAEPLCQNALALCKQLLGETHPEIAACLNNLAGIYHNQGHYSEAEPLFQEALILRQQSLGRIHPEIAESLNNLAGLYCSQGRYSEAEPLYQKALALRQELLGEAHPDVATSLNNLAALYLDQGRYNEAEPLYQQSLALYIQLLGEAHPIVATSLNNLAGLYHNQDCYSKAEPLYQEALALRQQLLGEAHPDVATSLINLAGLYRDQGRYNEAEPLYQEALALYKKLLGEAHPKVATTLNNLAGLYANQGRYNEAEPLYQEALALYKKLLGEAHPKVATTLNNLAGLYQSQCRYNEAELLYQKALTLLKQLLGNEHPSTKIVQANLQEMRKR